MNILCWQLQIIYKMKTKRYYLNVPARLLCSLQAVQCLLPATGGIVLEVRDPHEFISLSCSERRAFNAHVRMIKSMGAELWLDDIKPDQFSDLADDLARFDGVKIDKSVILEEPSSLSSLIADCARYVQFVLVEGWKIASIMKLPRRVEAIFSGDLCGLKSNFISAIHRFEHAKDFNK